jgi:hypothetical protein
MRLRSEERIVIGAEVQFCNPAVGYGHRFWVEAVFVPAMTPYAGRHIVDSVVSAVIRHGKEGMAEDENERVHVRVDFAEHADDAGASKRTV